MSNHIARTLFNHHIWATKRRDKLVSNIQMGRRETCRTTSSPSFVVKLWTRVWTDCMWGVSLFDIHSVYVFHFCTHRVQKEIKIYVFVVKMHTIFGCSKWLACGYSDLNFFFFFSNVVAWLSKSQNFRTVKVMAPDAHNLCQPVNQISSKSNRLRSCSWKIEKKRA